MNKKTIIAQDCLTMQLMKIWNFTMLTFLLKFLYISSLLFTYFASKVTNSKDRYVAVTHSYFMFL